jgi:hypothetical protein
MLAKRLDPPVSLIKAIAQHWRTLRKSMHEASSAMVRKTNQTARGIEGFEVHALGSTVFDRHGRPGVCICGKISERL